MDAMHYLVQLWLPIVVSAAAVWIASVVACNLIGHHSKDWDSFPNEEAGLSAIRGLNLRPGCYGFPRMDRKDFRTPEGMAKWDKGPTGFLRVWGKTNMGANMLASLVIFLIVSTLIAYLATVIPLPRGDRFFHVFQVLGTAGILAYVFAGLPVDVWFQQKPRAIALYAIDGIVFGLITGAVFAALWPKV